MYAPAEPPEAGAPNLPIEDITQRAQTAEARDRLAAIVESSADAIISTDLHGIITSWNRGAERLFGYTAQEAIGQPVKMLIPSDRANEEPDILERIRRGESIEHYETVRWRKDGALLDISLTVSPIIDGRGQIVGASKIARDITVRKQAEAELGKSEERRTAINEQLLIASMRQRELTEAVNERYRVLYAALPVAAFVCDRNAVIQNYNSRAVELWGREPKAGVEQHCGSMKLILPDGTLLPHAHSPMMEVLRTGTACRNVEVFIERPNGSRIPVIVNFCALKDAQGEVVGVVTSFDDISERKRAEDALRESEARFRAMADNIAPLAWMANPDGWIFFYNRRWYDYTGTTFEEMQGWGWDKVHHPKHLQRVVEKWRGQLRKGEAWEDTFPLRGKDGQYRWFLSRAFPIRDSEGKIARWFGTNTDVTELREAQELLGNRAKQLETLVEKRTADLRETVGELEAFSYSIAHDMRAPLRSLLGYGQFLVEEYDGKIDAIGQDYLRRITHSADRMDRLIQDVLNYSKIVRAELPLEPVDVEKLLQGILESYPNLQGEGTSISLEGPFPRVLGNQATLTQCLSNLLGNAAKFVAPGVKPAVRVWSEARNGHIRLFVRDNGIGIAPDQHEKIFAIFQRVSKNYDGTGIGLAIAKKAAERMGGSVGLESQLGQGSTFWIDLKRADSEN